LVWDLDNTLWNGNLAEGDEPTVLDTTRELIRRLDQRGILLSIASKNESRQALTQLRRLNLDAFFLVPQINWNPKSSSIKQIADALNLPTDSIAFVDDQPFEREEVQFHFPEVRVYPTSSLPQLGDLPEFTPTVTTMDASRRRLMYQQDIERQQAETVFQGTNEAFLKSLSMTASVRDATEGDLERLEELTQRTHQLNTTGILYTHSELKELLYAQDHKVWVVSLNDRFGSYGKIGLAVIQLSTNQWRIRLLLLSCRVISRGIGNAFINYIMQRAYSSNASLVADFKPTDRNRMMYITYKFAGFEDTSGDMQSPATQLLRCELQQAPDLPDYLTFV